MGVGGGFLIVPMMIYLLRMPLRMAVGTSLFQILFTCVGVTYMQAVTNHTVDLELALLVGAGSAVGAQLGVQLNRHMRGEHLKVLLASLALVVAVKWRSSRSSLRPVSAPQRRAPARIARLPGLRNCRGPY